MSIALDGNSLTFSDLSAIANGAPLSLAQSARKKVEDCRLYIEQKLSSGEPIYGVNTGFGYYAQTAIPPQELKELQLNLLKSHASGHGEPLSLGETRLAMALRLNVLMKGHTGVRWELCEALLSLITHEIYPVIPARGSVGASGDLAPLAHLALPLVGLGKVHYRGEIMPADEALAKAGLTPIELQEKEGLGLINGTQVMLAIGGLALSEALPLLHAADLICALSFEALRARTKPLEPHIHHSRGQLGQIASAARIKGHLEGSSLFTRSQFPRVQDPYSIRCAPQVHGASQDTLDHVNNVLTRELNAATDNPLVYPQEDMIVSGGNFHGQPIAIAFDLAAIALSELASISERRIELLLNPQFSHLPAFLSPKEGTHSGYMAAQYLAASSVNENKLLAHPASTDSIPGNVGVEDHVSMGMTAAHKLKTINLNLKRVLTVELLCAAQACDLRSELPTGIGTKPLYTHLRELISPLKADRILADEIELLIQRFDSVIQLKGALV